MSNYVRHVLHPDPDNPLGTWCGKGSVLDWCFEGLDHALLNASQGSGLLCCPDCVEAATRTLLAPLPAA